jgi:RNA polymerase sigma-70 factor (ECF subfamily)
MATSESGRDATREAAFAENRPLLFSIAYRMLGSAADAEDIVQECYLRWRGAEATEIHAPRRYLATVATRLSINQLRSARARREEYVGPWLPEPVVTEKLRDPVELAESLTMAFLVMLESLSPVERAVFLLSEVFDYEMAEIAEIVGKTPANCRQILHRARQAMAQRRRRYEAGASEVRSILKRFGEAASGGDLEGLLVLLDPEAVLFSDGGGKVSAALRPVRGARNIAKFFAGIARKRALEGLSSIYAQINRQPALVSYRDGSLQSALVFDLEGDRIRALYIVANPEKLKNLAKELTL